MNAAKAAEATGFFKPDLAIPYHWGRIVGTIADARQFAELAQCRVKIMEPGEIISSDNWLDDAPLIAHWKLDESEGDIASDNVSGLNGTLHGEPIWQPDNGKLAGALELDGTDDYISTDFVLDPAIGPFSAFVWIKTHTSGRPVISQANGTGTGRNWLSINPSDGFLMTDLRTTGRGGNALISELSVTDNDWHHIGFVWDGAYRYLYIDGMEAAKDNSPIAALEDSDGGLYFGTTTATDDFFAGMIDDIRIFGGAITP